MGKERNRVGSNSSSGGSGLVKCPYCGFDGGVSVFKLLRDPWRFRFYEVKMLECPKCRGAFNYYEDLSPKGKRPSFVIRVKPKVRF